MHDLAGKPAPKKMLENIPRLVSDYYSLRPDPQEVTQRVSFGTSGHRGRSAALSFNEAHIVAISRAVVEYRSGKKIDGPLFIGMDTHALSEPAFVTALEVLAAAGVTVMIQRGRTHTPTPVISHAILAYNKGRASGLADGIVITPSHNPPSDGGFKYNETHGGPADTSVTAHMEKRANEILVDGFENVKRLPFAAALQAETTHEYDYVKPYVDDLKNSVDMNAIRDAGLKIGVDPMGGAGVGYWAPIAETYGIALDIINPDIDPTFSFMTVDHDGKIRMDCSSPYAMAGLIKLKDRFDIAFGNDPDFDRHGIVTRSGGIMNPNHYLSVAIDYLYRNRPEWPDSLNIGKTLVSSSMIDRVATALGRNLMEVPVGFKWFVAGLHNGTTGFGGEESSGASFLRTDGSVWSTDKDGIILNLLAAEITAITGKDPAELYKELEERHGSPTYQRIDAPASRAEKAALKKLSPDQVTAQNLAGDPIITKLTEAPGNGAPIGGLKVVTRHGWFAARPSGTEDINKIYAESFRGVDHLKRIQDEAKEIVAAICV